MNGPVFLLHVASTLAMAGLIWFVQVVHYPLFAGVNPRSFEDYEAEHVRRTGRIVLPLMTVELLTSLILLWQRPEEIPLPLLCLGLALLAVIWISTAAIQAPLHGKLRRGYDADAHRTLVRTNWVRTWAWTCRALLVLAMVRALTAAGL